jgi:hypothetical protein
MKPVRGHERAPATGRALDLDGVRRLQVPKSQGVAGAEDDALIWHDTEQ